MITAAQIAPLRTASPDYPETERLKVRFARLRQERKRPYLTATEFEQILVWKIRQQIGRQRELRTANTERIIRQVTNLALTVTHSDTEYELELRVGALCLLRGVDVPVASAVLALVLPEKYAVIDFPRLAASLRPGEEPVLHCRLQEVPARDMALGQGDEMATAGSRSCHLGIRPAQQ